MLTSAMPENPTYRVTGDDWDPPVADPPARAEEPAAPAIVPERPAPEPAFASPPRPSPAAAAPGDDQPFGTAYGVVAGSSAGATAATLQGSNVAGLLARLAPPLAPALERISPRVLIGGAGVLVAAVAILVLTSGRPAGVAATATATPTVLAPSATPGCPTLAASLPIPNLIVQAPGEDPRRLAGFGSVEGRPDADGPWPPDLGSVEAELVMGSTLQLTSAACIGEWRAVAARPPTTTGKPWRPDAPETLQLGWQQADRVGWEPSVPLPARGEWIVRVTVWYRDGDGASPAGSPATSAEPLEPVVERYFRLLIVPRDV